MDLEEARDFMTSLATDTGDILLGLYDTTIRVDFKGRVDAVTEADTAAEKHIIDTILGEYPDHSILSEESGCKDSGADYLWLIDPLDGTTNFAHGFPVFCVSIGLFMHDEPLAGCVLDPLRRETFFAYRGKGAWLNNERMSVSSVERLDRALMATGFPYDKENLDDYMPYVMRILPRVMGLRRAGAAAIDLAYVAAGRLDAYWELRLKPWDTAAGTLLVEEAGGTVSDLGGGQFDVYMDNVVVSNGMLHQDVIGTLGGK